MKKDFSFYKSDLRTKKRGGEIIFGNGGGGGAGIYAENAARAARENCNEAWGNATHPWEQAAWPVKTHRALRKCSAPLETRNMARENATWPEKMQHTRRKHSAPWENAADRGNVSAEGRPMPWTPAFKRAVTSRRRPARRRERAGLPHDTIREREAARPHAAAGTEGSAGELGIRNQEGPHAKLGKYQLEQRNKDTCITAQRNNRQ